MVHALVGIRYNRVSYFDIKRMENMMSSSLESDTTTHCIRIHVLPRYLPDHSDSEENRFVFSYRITITNNSDHWVKLVRRHWIIINAASMYLFFVKGYYPTFVLYVFYTVIACWGYKRWYEEHEQRNGLPIASL